MGRKTGRDPVTGKPMLDGVTAITSSRTGAVFQAIDRRRWAQCLQHFAPLLEMKTLSGVNGCPFMQCVRCGPREIIGTNPSGMYSGAIHVLPETT